MIDIILVTYNRIETLKKILSNVNTYHWKYNTFLIVDNNSTDGTKDWLSTVDGMDVLFMSENVGHGAALAKGLKYIHSKKLNSSFTIFLEDDSIPEKNLIDYLYDKIIHSEFDLISSSGKLVRLGKRIEVVPKDNKIVHADFCLFDGAIMKNIVFEKIGYPVENWFMMFDDFEYCYRIKNAGFVIGIVKNDFHHILHFGAGEKFSSSSLWRGYYQTRNHLFFLKKHFNLFNLIDFLILNTKRTLASLIPNDRVIRFKFRILGILHGFMNKKGKTLNPQTLTFNHINTCAE